MSVLTLVPPVPSQRSDDVRQSRLAPGYLLDVIDSLTFCLFMGATPVFRMPTDRSFAAAVAQAKAEPPTPKEWRPMTKEDITRYTTLLKHYTGLLDKTLPDLKAIALDDSRDAKVLDPLVLAQRLAGVRAMLDPGPQLQAIPAQPQGSTN